MQRFDDITCHHVVYHRCCPYTGALAREDHVAWKGRGQGHAKSWMGEVFGMMQVR
jgi:hypothetical protein